MANSADDEGFSAPDADQGHPVQPAFNSARPSSSPTRSPTQGPGFSPRGDGLPAHPATEASQPQTADDAGGENTVTVTGEPRLGGAAGHGQAGSGDSPTATAPSPGSSEARYGRGVPGAARADVGRAGVSAEEVWRTGQLPARRPRHRPWRRWLGTALAAVLLIACGVAVYLRLHHTPLTVTGATITSQVKNGCAVDVTGRINTSGGAGTVAYQWVFTPQVTAPHPLSQSVTTGQSAVYVTVSVQGTGHGQATQQVTLQVLGPGQRSASTHVSISC